MCVTDTERHYPLPSPFKQDLLSMAMHTYVYWEVRRTLNRGMGLVRSRKRMR